MPTGYCTVEDVGNVLKDRDLLGSLDPEQTDVVAAAIAGQTEWVQETTNRHWYEPDTTDDLLPAEPLTHSNDELDVPSSPHADNMQMQVAASRQRRYPVRRAGPYTRVTLTRRDIVDITELLVRDNTGAFIDWVAEKEQGQGEDYYLQVDDDTGFTRLYLHTGALPRLSDYDNAVVVTYEYGIDGLSDTVRRAVAMRAAAELLNDDDAALGIPENAGMVPAESRIQTLERQAEDLLEIHI